jgi:hypothetical protein
MLVGGQTRKTRGPNGTERELLKGVFARTANPIFRSFVVAEGQLLECSFLIPIHGDADLSDGDEHRIEDWDWLSEEMFARFGGGTVAPGLWEGFYTDRDTGNRVADESRKYIVALPPDQFDPLRNLLAECCRVFSQKCIYLSIAGEVEFISSPDIGTIPSMN